MLKNTHIWLNSYIRQCLLRKASRSAKKPMHIIFCLVDHFEPKWDRPSMFVEDKRIDAWLNKYSTLVSRHMDRDSISPRHTFFYPEEEYEKRHLDKLAFLCQQGLGEVEIHLHHDNDTEDGLRQKIEDYKEKLVSHGLLSEDRNGNIRYGFIHGNWALNNSRRDGRWCGVNNELGVLKETGCYADFTLPSAPSDTQTAKINSIYYAKDTPLPKSHNIGVDVEVGREPSGDLMIIQGPLTLNWKKRKFGIFPRIENSGISLNNAPARERIDLWIGQKVSVVRKPEWIFVKIYTHGTQIDNCENEYFGNLDLMFSYLEKKYNDGSNYRLHYVTARQMYNIIKAAEAGERGEPGAYRDYLLQRVGHQATKSVRHQAMGVVL